MKYIIILGILRQTVSIAAIIQEFKGKQDQQRTLKLNKKGEVMLQLKMITIIIISSVLQMLLPHKPNLTRNSLDPRLLKSYQTKL